MSLNIEINETQKAISKIKKLLALNDRAGTEAEAFAAMAKAQELLIKHGLDMDNVKIANGECYEVDHSQMDKQQAPWKVYIWDGCAHLYFCSFFYKRHQKVNSLVGKSSNLQICKYLIEYIIRTGESIATKEALFLPSGSRRSYKHSFLLGFAYTINSRCKDEIKRAKEEGIKDQSTGNMLVVKSLYEQTTLELEATLQQMKINPKASKYTPSLSNGGAFKDGKEAAKNISLSSNAINSESSSIKYITNQ